VGVYSCVLQTSAAENSVVKDPIKRHQPQNSSRCGQISTPSSPHPTIAAYREDNDRSALSPAESSEGEPLVTQTAARDSQKLYEGQILCREKHPNVIYTGGRWVSISCHICGPNAYRRDCISSTGFYKGLGGLLRYMVSFHNIPTGRTEDAVLELCREDPVGPATAEMIRGYALVKPLAAMRFAPAATKHYASPTIESAEGAAVVKQLQILCTKDHANAMSRNGTWVHISCHLCGANA
jgi:hypothetical protein